MNINSLSEYNGGTGLVLLSNDNPFKKGTLQYVLVEFMIKNYSRVERFNNDHNNKLLLDFLSTRKETFHIDSWNGSHLFESALNICLVNNIVKIKRKITKKIFGLFAEDGLLDVLSLPQFTNHFSLSKHTDLNPESLKLLWLSLYMNRTLKSRNKVPNISFNQKNFSYTENKYSISLTNLPYNKIYNTHLQLPLAAFSDCWHSEDWIGLNSRGLFHHIGDHVGFYYGANSVGSCLFVGRNQTNHLVTLSKNSGLNLPQFTDIHPSDFVYVYGVPKGTPDIYSNPMVISSEEEDCQKNDLKNVIQAEHFWNNSVFMNNTNRKMFAGSLEDKFKDILTNIKEFMSPEQNIVIDKIINNKTVTQFDLIHNQLHSSTCPAESVEKIMNHSRFFMKSLAHKTVCELINPIETLELGFFMKHSGSKPIVKTMFIFNLLASSESKIKKPLHVMKEAFIKKYLKNDLDYVKAWSGDNKISYLFSEIVTMRNEYRMFIIDNRVVATSPCYRNSVPLNAWQNGRFDPRLVNGHNDQYPHLNRERVAKYAKFARSFCQQMKQENPDCKNYVLDVAWCDEKQTVVPIEINSITWSGAYQINMHRVCAATVNQTYEYEDLNTYLVDKFSHWINLIEDKIIEAKPFDLCGLDRTIKGKTLPSIENLVTDYFDRIEAFNHPVIENVLEDDEDLLEDDIIDYDNDINIFIDDTNTINNSHESVLQDSDSVKATIPNNVFRVLDELISLDDDLDNFDDDNCNNQDNKEK